MIYEKQNFSNGMVLTADHLSHIEDGIVAAEESFYTNTNLTEAQQAQARENIGITNDPDVHAKYFTITDDGVVSLKPEYRGATNKADYVNDISDMGVGKVGSKNTELPKHLIIPEIVDRKVVHSLALAIFRYNHALENVTLPSTISAIPARCFDGCNKLKNVYNTDNIKSVGQVAFQNASISRIRLPNLEEFESTSAFQNCGSIVYADIGKVTALPDRTFNSCANLHMVKNASTIASVGQRCFYLTPNLNCADFITDLKNIGEWAFLRSGFDCDWAGLENCTFGTNATPMQYNPTDYWSNRTFTACENRLPTFLFQDDARWKTRQIGTSGIPYDDGCVLMAIMHAYCGLHNLELSTVVEFEQIVGNDWLNSYTMKNADIKTHAEGLGLKVDRYGSLRYDANGNFDDTILQTVYDALAAGKYVLFGYSEPSVPGHLVVIYGVNENGDFLIADSLSLNRGAPEKYILPVSKLGTPEHHDNFRVHIVSL